MKAKYLYLLVFALCAQLGFSQIVTIYVDLDNNDKETRAKLGTVIGAINARNISHGVTNDDLRKAINDHKEQLRLQYTKNSFDKKDNFSRSVGFSLASSAAMAGFLQIPGLMYMTGQKRDYIMSTVMDKMALASIAKLSYENISSGKRQEIYRLRKELINLLSKHDGDARSQLLFSAAGIVASNPDLILGIIDQLTSLDFINPESQETDQLLNNDIIF